MVVLVGTSGYSFPDWKGTYYPRRLPERKMLAYYAGEFPTVEINTSFYQLPTARLFKKMLVRVPEEFQFWVKLYQGLTHFEPWNQEWVRNMLDSIAPLHESGHFSGFLAQFPWRFRNLPASWERIQRLAESIFPYALAIEFRHRSWDRPETYQRLRDWGLIYCIVDEPQISGLMPPRVEVTAPLAYIRLHGRNAAQWWAGNGRDRYNYLYSKSQLAHWVKRIHEMEPKTRKIFVFFNNCHAGQAARNAQMLREMLDQPLPTGRLF